MFCNVLKAFYSMIKKKNEEEKEVSPAGRRFRETDRRTHGPAVGQPAALPVVQRDTDLAGEAARHVGR